ncbi:oxidoreductase [Pseudoclavibacter sp. RFBG4]|uniref:SDR family NAD(P)-dependent oxidoreductase n=1 Tax=Pseudoclavibacter sp. RFBG4 TaxID=2080575 RepID=UPI000CE82285|nr:SDR family oxidoreductase [Pseudoclavibacter sp. RFBG4]PPG35890.1 oxidoreductase [Pseudoclavibacter sp. RFBG4]
MHIDLSGRTALVTGSTQGIGLAIAADLAAAGAHVIVNGRGAASVESAVAELRGRLPGTTIEGVPADLATAEGAAVVRSAFPDLDILANNLGIYGSTPAFEISDEEWLRYFEVNVLSAARLMREYLPGMTSRGWGRVISIASDSAVVIPEEMIHYGMTKTALLAVSRGYAKAVKGTGVTVNAVIAGPTHTGGVEAFVAELVGDDLAWDDAQREFMRRHRPQSLIERLIEPEEIAHLVTYLASPLASATTGGALRVDGGYVDSILP